MMFDNITLVTNHHVIEGADLIIADSDDGYQYFITKVLITSPEKDIAILQFMSPTVMRPLICSEAPVKQGEKVVAIGSPIGLKNTVSMGNISAVYMQNEVRRIQFTAAISQRSSGGALLNEKGEVIGITSAYFAGGQNLNLAVDIAEAVDLYQKWDGRTYKLADRVQAVYVPPTPTPAPTPMPSPSPTPQAVNYGALASFAIDLGPNEAKLFAGDKLELKPSIVPLGEDAPGKTGYRWASSNEEVARASEKGVAKAVAQGDAVITCFAQKDETVYTLLFVHVAIPVEEIALSETSVALLLNAPNPQRGEITLTAQVLPENAQAQEVTWASSDPEVATVDEAGRVLALKEGTATITAASHEEGRKAKKASCKIKVTQAVAEITAKTKTLSLFCGRTTSLSPTVSPKSAGSKKLVWSSSDKVVATVSSSGEVKAQEPGSCTVTCQAADEGGHARL